MFSFSFLKRNRNFYKTLGALALPLMLQNLINSSLQLVDTVMVGMLGQNELAGVSLANTPFFIGMLFVFGLMSGGAVLISQYWGKRDLVTINRIMGLSFYFGGAISFLFASAVFLFPEQIMGLITNNPDLHNIAVRYGKNVAYANFVNAIVMVYIGAHRSTENPKLGLYVVGSSMIINTILNWILIFGKFGFPALGVEGAAISTLISRIIELIIVVVYALFFDKHLKIIPKAFFKPGTDMLKDFIKYATPVVMNETFWALGISMLPIIYGHMPNSADVVAGHSVSGNVERIVTIAIFAMANVASILVGKEIGRGASEEEVQSFANDLLGLSTVIGALNGVILIILTRTVIMPYVFPLFNLSAEAQRIANYMLHALSIVLFLRAYNSTNIVGILRGGGDVKVCMLLDVLPLYIYTVPVAAITALVLKWDIQWVYSLIMIEEFIKAATGYKRIRSKKWINNVTREFA